MNSTRQPVTHKNVLMVARDPHPGDDTDPQVLALLPASNRTGLTYIMRKGPKFHAKIKDRVSTHRLGKMEHVSVQCW